MHKFPDDAHPYYFDAVLRGISGSNLDVKAVLNVCRRCHEIPGRPCGQWITHPIVSLKEKILPYELLDIIIWYATEAPEPDKELWHTKTSSGGGYDGGDILSAGLNSVRGAAAGSMAQLIFDDKNRAQYFMPSIEKMVNDPSIAVRAHVAAVLIALLNYNQNKAVELFGHLCNTEDVLLETHEVERFLTYTVRNFFSNMRPIIERMINSDIPKVVRTGARIACLSSFFHNDAQKIADLCISGTDEQRIGAAQVFSANVKTAPFRQKCEDTLKQLFHDPSEKVRKKAGDFLRYFKITDELNDYVLLIENYVNSSAFSRADNHYLFSTLEETKVRLPELTCFICEKYLDTIKKNPPGNHIFLEKRTISKLVVRVYSQYTDKELQSRCLNLIDSMAEMGIHDLDEALAFYERS